MKRAHGFVLATAVLGLVAVVGWRFSARGRSVGPAVTATGVVEPRAPDTEPALPARKQADEAERTDESRAEATPPRTADTLSFDSAARVHGGSLLCVVHGRVVDPEGRRTGSWKPFVSLTDAAGVRRNTETRGDGHYSLAGLAPGKWTLHWGGVGFRDESQPLELTAEDPIVRRDLTIRRALALKIRVTTPAGEPLYAALRTRSKAGLSNPETPLPVATLDAPPETIEEANDAGENQVGVGTFWSSGPLAAAAGPKYMGVLLLTVDLPVFVSLAVGARVVATQRVEPSVDEVSFVVDLEALLARQATVRVRFLGAGHGEALRGGLEIEPLDRIVSVGDGSWSATLAPGSYTLRFRAQGYASAAREITLAPGQELDLGDIVLPPELTIEGRLLDPEGNPVLGRLVVGQRDERGILRFDDTLELASALDGRYKITGLSAARYVLRTAGDDEVVFPGRKEPPTVWVSGNVAVSTLGGSVRGFDLHLARAGVLTLKNAETLPSGSSCKVLDERGDVFRHQGFTPGFVPRLLLPPGAYTLVVCDEEWSEISRRSLEIAAGTTEVDLGR